MAAVIYPEHKRLGLTQKDKQSFEQYAGKYADDLIGKWTDIQAYNYGLTPNFIKKIRKKRGVS